VGKV
jgi:hypothetical protein